MQLVLDVDSGDDRMLDVHDVLCFAYDRALPHSLAHMFCIRCSCPLGWKSLTSTNGGTCFYKPNMLPTPDVASFGIVKPHPYMLPTPDVASVGIV